MVSETGTGKIPGGRVRIKKGRVRMGTLDQHSLVQVRDWFFGLLDLATGFLFRSFVSAL